MTSRYSSTSASTSALAMHSHTHDTPSSSPGSSRKVWIDPASLPNEGDISTVSGNAPGYVKQLNYNTYHSYGVGAEDCFGYKVGKEVKFVDVSINRKLDRQERLEATTVAEVVVNKYMLNGAGMLHGGCVAYLIDNCCSTPLLVLGLIQNVNGVGVTQAMNVLFHSPAPIGTCLQIKSTSVSLGGRVMTSRCEVVDKHTGRPVASAFLNKMQPNQTKL
ncbi:HotDog domain-containing protein [Lentinula detonsa]|uniref:HotDog domain-containing protein n=2 Tax=Lentinula TaxID=5352 RepID=A0AA38KS03_9AGAR|nr:HotDog domain-containing protein [Lentinula detonsa]KAJ3787395.1 HotDog domain-containing protein [Lentinula aff. detonsa]KAJ3794663.1 HotDog domain-containing protein [Lentinula aff. detonsa]